MHEIKSSIFWIKKSVAKSTFERVVAIDRLRDG